MPNNRLIVSSLSVIFAIASLLVVPIMVYINYSMLDKVDMSLERIEANLTFAPYIYLFLIICSISCGITGFVRSSYDRKVLVISSLGVVFTILSLLFFSQSMYSLWIDIRAMDAS